jgi:transcriptional regulator with XRE-family HTH domain|tara:strand:- start:141 stop:428 length:288 start_codon:yes stop_codon:yes gene_type:complete
MSDNIYQHIGQQMKMRRIAGKNNSGRLITQSELAQACNVTFQQIQKYEKGNNKIPIDKLLKVAKYLNTPVLNFIPAAEYTAVEQYTQEQLNESQQ